MLAEANTLLIDQPTNHLDLESIQSVNKGFKEFKGALLLTSHDHRLLNTVCNKAVILGDLGSHTFEGTLDEYLGNERVKEIVKKLYIKK